MAKVGILAMGILSMIVAAGAVASAFLAGGTSIAAGAVPKVQVS
jgi:hypothetical protein